MSEETFLQQIEREAQQLQEELIKNNLKTYSRWWKVRLNDFKKKHHIEKICLTKEPPKVSFTIWQSCFLSNDFEYIGNVFDNLVIINTDLIMDRMANLRRREME